MLLYPPHSTMSAGGAWGEGSFPQVGPQGELPSSVSAVYLPTYPPQCVE